MPGTSTQMDKTISKMTVIHRAKSQSTRCVWNSKRSHQYQTAKPAPAPSSACRIQAFTCHMPHSRPIPMASHTPPLTAIYTGPGGVENSSSDPHHWTAEIRRNPLHIVRLNTIHSNRVTLNGRFINNVSANWGVRSFGRVQPAQNTPHPLFLKRYASLGISVVDTRILGCKRAYARLHPKIRPSSRQTLESQRYASYYGTGISAGLSGRAALPPQVQFQSAMTMSLMRVFGSTVTVFNSLPQDGFSPVYPAAT